MHGKTSKESPQRSTARSHGKKLQVLAGLQWTLISAFFLKMLIKHFNVLVASLEDDSESASTQGAAHSQLVAIKGWRKSKGNEAPRFQQSCSRMKIAGTTITCKFILSPCDPTGITAACARFMQSYGT